MGLALLDPSNPWLDSTLKSRVISLSWSSLSLISVTLLHLYIYLSNLIPNIYLTDLLSLSYISTDILLEEPDISSVEASVDLINSSMSILYSESIVKNTNKNLIINPF